MLRDGFMVFHWMFPPYSDKVKKLIKMAGKYLTWSVVFGIWHLASGIWHLASGIWHLAAAWWSGRLCDIDIGVWFLLAKVCAVGGARTSASATVC